MLDQELSVNGQPHIPNSRDHSWPTTLEHNKGTPLATRVFNHISRVLLQWLVTNHVISKDGAAKELSLWQIKVSARTSRSESTQQMEHLGPFFYA